MIYYLPIPFVAILLILALARSRFNLLAPSVVICGLYFLVTAGSLAVDTDSSITNNTVVSTAAFTLLLLISLSPVLLLRRPDWQFMRVTVFNRFLLNLFSFLGLYGFLYLFPYAIQSLALNAYSVREIQDVTVLTPSIFLTFAVVPATFFGLYGLLLFSPIGRQCNAVVRLGLAAGFSCYALNDLCHKGRDWVIQYLFLGLLYVWMFSKNWSRRTKKAMATCAIGTTLLAVAYVAVITRERFGPEGTGLGLKGGIVDYIGEQTYIFDETVREEDFTSSVRQIMFPVYYSMRGEKAPDTMQYLNSRTKRYQWSFGTFLASGYMLGGWRGLWICVPIFAVLFASAFRVVPPTRAAFGYSAATLLYYQFLFQGAFYWQMYGRAWNYYVLVMLCIVISCFIVQGSMRRRRVPVSAADGNFGQDIVT